MKIQHAKIKWLKGDMYLLPTINVWNGADLYPRHSTLIIEFKWLGLRAGVIFGEEIF